MVFATKKIVNSLSFLVAAGFLCVGLSAGAATAAVEPTTTPLPPDCRPLSPEHWQQAHPDWRIGRIQLQVNNIFDTSQPDQNHRINRLANRFHIKTRDKVVARELLFAPGDPYDPRVLAETERHLRQFSFIRDALVEPVALCGNQVVVKVVTTDNWTLTPNISFGRGGGKNRWAVEIEEENFLGLGKNLQIKYRNGIDRTEKILRYLDPNMGGSRQRLKLLYQNNSDGHIGQVEWQLPFYSLDSRHGWGLNLFSNRLSNPVYRNGEIAAEIGQKRQLAEIWVGRSPGFVNGATRRYRLGFTDDDSRFYATDNFPAQTQPADRHFAYPWLGFEYLQDRFIEKTNLQHMGRVEDISLGHHLQTRLGWSHVAFGATDSDMVWRLDYSKGWQPNANQLVLLDTGLNGLYGDGAIHNATANGKLQWFRFQSRHRSFYIKTQVQLGHKLFPEQQNTLGGENGLRGFPVRYLTAPNNALLTLEQRFYFDWYPYHLLQFGASIFADVGTAWGSDDPTENRTVQDLGLGLRLVPTEAANGKVIHIDFAFPVNDSTQSGFQVILEARNSF
jgi:outer membrane protein assembly factor BamA